MQGTIGPIQALHVRILFGAFVAFEGVSTNLICRVSISSFPLHLKVSLLVTSS